MVNEGCDFFIADSWEEVERQKRVLDRERRRRKYISRFVHLVGREPHENEWGFSEYKMTELFKKEHKVLGPIGSFFLKLIRPFRYGEDAPMHDDRPKSKRSRFVSVDNFGESLQASSVRERNGQPTWHKSVQLWEDGPYWAETNIGAENPWNYGYYFWWGDTVGYNRVKDVWEATDGSVSGFSFEKDSMHTCGKDITALKQEGKITVDGILTMKYDATQVLWGGRWRMPTDQELRGLVNKCDWIWTTMNGVNGYVVRGRSDYTTASIFLPAAGIGYEDLLRNVGAEGYYWSSVPEPDDDGGSYGLFFHSAFYYTSYYNRRRGMSVRPVQEFH